MIGGDFLLAYKLDERSKPGSIVFVRTGTHAELFE
jgi:mRNA interferase YafQ